ncbi:hypothetical protein B0J11DRAFT_238384 [Dendryphion nanum]|uniref:Secreted protein n=1 Tax=Dendryphion nanum TaxID=256645 RepID=A0A9P9I793_9PLEO|nr:hypothetical protein B0J11DRAFT_238384 [Dendryphion nanum]
MLCMPPEKPSLALRLLRLALAHTCDDSVRVVWSTDFLHHHHLHHHHRARGICSKMQALQSVTSSRVGSVGTGHAPRGRLFACELSVLCNSVHMHHVD